MFSSIFFGVLAASVAGAAGTAGGTAAPSIPTPPTLVVSGRGWGHGVGMGQYGALGYAQRGQRYRKILAHFYPGTTIAQASVAQVRVLLAEGATTLVVGSGAAFRVRDANGRSYQLQAGQYRIGATLAIKLDAAGPARRLPGPLLFTPGRVPLALGQAYRGSIQVISKDGRLQAVNIVRLEDYVRGVVSQEVSKDWPAEALKAQAVASRSYVVATRKPGAFDVFADTRSQVYGGVNAEEFSTSAAVNSTAGQVLVYRGQPAITYFFASSGGRTAAVQDAWPGARPIPYLVSVPDPYDTTSPYHRWGPYVFSASSFAQRLGIGSILLDARVARNPSRRVTSVSVKTATGRRTISGTDVRRAFSLRSSWFSIGVLSLSRPVKPLVYGVAGRLGGIARGVKGARLERRARGVWKSVAAVVPARGGAFAASVKLTAGGFYRLSNGKVSSAPVRIAVAPFIRLDPAVDATSLTGRARPVIPGLQVSIQRYVGSTWQQVGQASLKASGRFQAKLKLTAGTYRARIAPGRGLVPGTSRVLQVVAA